MMCERVEKIIDRTLCFMRQRIFRPIYIFNNYAYFVDFRAKKIPFDLFEFKSSCNKGIVILEVETSR